MTSNANFRIQRIQIDGPVTFFAIWLTMLISFLNEEDIQLCSFRIQKQFWKILSSLYRKIFKECFLGHPVDIKIDIFIVI